MTKNTIGVIIAIILIVGGGIIIYKNSSDKTPAETPATTETKSDSTELTPAGTVSVGVDTKVMTKTYTMTEVSTHNSSQSCWTAINAKVYDVTAWISKHPGGKEAILSLCGKDGSSAFNNQHGGQEKPETTLAAYFIGDLSK